MRLYLITGIAKYEEYTEIFAKLKHLVVMTMIKEPDRTFVKFNMNDVSAT